MFIADRELLRRAQHDDAAFDLFRKRFSRKVSTIIKNNCKEQDFEDVVQEFYVSLLQYAGEVRNVEAYVKRCAYTVARRYYRKKSEPIFDGEVVDDHNPGKDFHKKYSTKTIIEYVVSLPEEYSDIILAIYFYNQSILRYANSAGVNYNTAKSRHARALELLRAEMN